MSELVSKWLTLGIDLLGEIMNRLIVAVIIVLLGFIIGRVVSKITQKILHELEIDKILKQTAKVKFSIEKSFSKFVAYFIYFLAIITALNQLGLTTTILHMISVAVLIIIVLSFALGVKDFIPNFIAGIHINRKNMLNKGDRIKVRGAEGKIVKIELTETKLKTKKGDIIFVPNSILIKEEIIKLKK